MLQEPFECRRASISRNTDHADLPRKPAIEGDAHELALHEEARVTHQKVEDNSFPCGLVATEEQCRSRTIPEFLEMLHTANFMCDTADNAQEPEYSARPHAQVVHRDTARKYEEYCAAHSNECCP